VEVTIDAGCDAGLLEAVYPWAGPTMRIEGWEVPEDEQRPVAIGAQSRRMFKGTLQDTELTIRRVPIRAAASIGRSRRSPRAADHEPVDGRGVPIHCDHPAPQDLADGRGAIPPAVMISRRQDLDAGKGP